MFKRLLFICCAFFLVISCTKRRSDSGQAGGFPNKLPVEGPAVDVRSKMSQSIAAMIARDGSFVGDVSPGIQQKFVERISRTQCAVEWVGFLQRKRYKLLIDQMRPSIESEQRIYNSDGSESYFIPTSVVGYWIEVRKFKDRSDNFFGRVEIREYAPVRPDPNKMFKRIYRWRATENCKKQSVTKKYQVFRPSPIPSFDDRALRDLIKGQPGLIYLWSPNMHYSTASLSTGQAQWGLKALFDVAQEKELAIKFLLDPRSDHRQAQRVANEMKARVPGLNSYEVVRGTSVELFMRMAGLHLPTLFYYQGGRISYNHLPGISTTEQIRNFIDEQKQLLNRASQGGQ